MVKHVVFDFDGTLADSEEVCFQLFNELAAKHGYAGLDRLQWAGLKLVPYAERLSRLGVSMLRVPFLAAEARRCYRNRASGLQAFPGIAETLGSLQELGCSLHVLSSNAVENISAFLDRQGLSVFETVSCERNFFGKHVALRRLLGRLGLRPADVIYVADELRDVEACRKAGVRIISAAWGFDPISLLESVNPGLTARTPRDVVRRLQELWRHGAVPEAEPALALAAGTFA